MKKSVGRMVGAMVVGGMAVTGSGLLTMPASADEAGEAGGRHSLGIARLTVHAGGVIELEGGGCAAEGTGGDVIINLNDPVHPGGPGTSRWTVKADADGNWALRDRVPATQEPGLHHLVAGCQLTPPEASFLYDTVPTDVKDRPTVTLSADSVAPGGSVEVSGGCEPGGKANVAIAPLGRTDPVAVASTDVGQQGDWTATLNLRPNVAPGRYHVWGVCEDGAGNILFAYRDREIDVKAEAETPEATPTTKAPGKGRHPKAVRATPRYTG